MLCTSHIFPTWHIFLNLNKYVISLHSLKVLHMHRCNCGRSVAFVQNCAYTPIIFFIKHWGWRWLGESQYMVVVLAVRCLYLFYTIFLCVLLLLRSNCNINKHTHTLVLDRGHTSRHSGHQKCEHESPDGIRFQHIFNIPPLSVEVLQWH